MTEKDKIAWKSRPIDNKHCCYCGRELEDTNKHSAYDYELHEIADDKSCCDNCNRMITETNAKIAQYLMSNKKEIMYLTEAIYNLTYFRDAELERIRNKDRNIN